MKTLFSFIILLFLIGYTQFSMAVDNSIYYGHWEGSVCNDQVAMDISREDVPSTINNTKITVPIEYDWNYPEISPYPFLNITFTDKNERENLLYAVISSETKTHKGYLIGFYEKSHIIPDSDGVLESFSEKLEMMRKD